MIQLNKKQAIITAFIVLHIVFFSNLYYLLIFGVKTNAEIHSKFGTSEESSNKIISFNYNSKSYEIKKEVLAYTLMYWDIERNFYRYFLTKSIIFGQRVLNC